MESFREHLDITNGGKKTDSKEVRGGERGRGEGERGGLEGEREEKEGEREGK